MKTLHLPIFLMALLVFSNSIVFADKEVTTSYGGQVGHRVADFKSDHETYSIWYKITNATVVGTPLDLPAKALIFFIRATDNGQLTVQLPRSIIDSKDQGVDKPYYVSIGEVYTRVSKVNATETSDDYIRTLTVNFPKYTSEIEIVGTMFAEKYPPMIQTPPKLSPLKQSKFGVESDAVQCISNLKLLIKLENNFPVCVKSTSVDRLLTQGWKLPENTSFQNLQTQFQSKIITKENAIAIVQEYVKEQNKTGIMNYSNSEIQTNLVYYITTSFPRVPVDYSTGIPTQVMDWLDGYYKNQHWWTELEKDYLGFPNHRIEAGHVAWELDYERCNHCIANNPIIFVDAITGKVIDTKWLY